MYPGQELFYLLIYFWSCLGRWKCQGQGSNMSHSSNLSHGSNNCYTFNTLSHCFRIERKLFSWVQKYGNGWWQPWHQLFKTVLESKQSYSSFYSLIWLFANGLPFTTHLWPSVANEHSLGQKETAGMLFLMVLSWKPPSSPFTLSHFSTASAFLSQTSSLFSLPLLWRLFQNSFYFEVHLGQIPPPFIHSTFNRKHHRWMNGHTMKEKQKPAIANDTD